MKIKKELEKNKLSYLDYYDFFKQEDFMRLQVIPFLDPHPNEIANRIIELDPGSEPAQKWLAEYYQQIGDNEKAKYHRDISKRLPKQ